jgi:hypothetical protein
VSNAAISMLTTHFKQPFELLLNLNPGAKWKYSFKSKCWIALKRELEIGQNDTIA